MALIAILVLGGLPHGAASEAPTAKALPGIASPGAPVTVTFTAPPPTVLDAVVGDGVTCTIRAPDGTSTPCGNMAQLVTVEVSPSSRSYSFDTTAPKVPGNYTIHFERKATLSVPSVDATADAPLAVLDAALDSNGVPTTTGTILPPLGPGLSKLAGGDAARWLASVMMGSAVLVGVIAIVRPRGKA